MISCKNCRASYTCACNLINGLCHSCYSKKNYSDEISEISKTEKKIFKMDFKYPKIIEETEISNFLKKSKGLTQEEKINRINIILQKARENKNENIL